MQELDPGHPSPAEGKISRTWLRIGPLLRLSGSVQWGVLLGLSVVLMALLQWAHLPAALLLGAMIAGILVGMGGGSVQVPNVPYWFSQVVIGCLVARVITLEILKTFAVHWALFLGIVLVVIAASCALGWVLTKLRFFPNTTAIWGLLPGAASVMMVMADDFGADGRLVAFMQYLRVVLVTVAAAVIAHFLHSSAHAAPVVWFGPTHWPAFLETLAFIVLSVIVGRFSKISGGMILVPLIAGSILQAAGVLTIELPRWFLAIGYAVLGWKIGLRFTREILMYAARTLPQTLFAVILLMAFCWGLAVVLVKVDGIDALTAYLATSPGGLDSATIIAASTKVDMPFVVSMQTARFLLVLLVGPILSRSVAGWITGQREPAGKKVGNHPKAGRRANAKRLVQQR